MMSRLHNREVEVIVAREFQKWQGSHGTQMPPDLESYVRQYRVQNQQVRRDSTVQHPILAAIPRSDSDRFPAEGWS